MKRHQFESAWRVASEINSKDLTILKFTCVSSIMESCLRSILLVLLSLSSPVYVASKSYDSCDGYQGRARRALSKNNNNPSEDLDNENIATAVQQWLYNRSGALLVYGRIEEWVRRPKYGSVGWMMLSSAELFVMRLDGVNHVTTWWIHHLKALVKT